MQARILRISGLCILLAAWIWGGSAAVQAAPAAQTVSVNLCASDGTITMPDSTEVPVWGFVLDPASCVPGLVTALPGPEIRAAAGDVVTINLTNALAVPTSILIAGQPVTASGGAAGDFTQEAGPGGGTATYTFTALTGSYVYESGTDPARQIPMGLYGALIVDSATAGRAYSAPSSAFDDEAVLVLSEIDADLNANPGGFNLQDWDPDYYLINGQAWPDTPTIATTPGALLLVRYVNAGFDHHAMAVLGTHQRIVARNSFEVTPSVRAVVETVPAGQSLDVVIGLSAAGNIPLYSRNMYVTNNGAGPGGMRTNITVSGAPIANIPPDAVDDSTTVNSGQAKVISVLANDSDLNGDSLTVTDVTAPTNGTAMIGAGGASVTYTNNGTGPGDSFTYTIDDGNGGTDTATVNVTVNSPPDAVNDPASTSAGNPVSVNVLVNDIDTDPLTVIAVTPGANGACTIDPGSTSVTYTPAGVFVGTDSCTYTISDGNGGNDTAMITVQVTNAAPVAVDDTATTPIAEFVTVEVLSNDGDADGHALSVTAITQPANGEAVLNPDNSVNYTPDDGFFGVDSFSYTVSDGYGGSDTGTVTVTVMDVADGSGKIYVSSSSNGTVQGQPFADEDILVYDADLGTWDMLLDMSDVGVTEDVDAFTFGPGGSSVLVSFDADIGNFPGPLGSVDDSDILQFTPTSWGTNTAGPAFTMYFDGSDVGLSANDEDIDALHRLTDGTLLVSTLGAFNVPGVGAGQDEDLIRFTGTFGSATSGTWTLHFDGSDVGLTDGSEDVWGVSSQAPPTGQIHLSTLGNYIVPSLAGDSDDIFICAPGTLGAATTCTYSLYWDGDVVGFGNEQLDGISINDGPTTVTLSALGPTTTDIAPAAGPDEEVQEDILDGTETTEPRILLPVIRH